MNHGLSLPPWGIQMYPEIREIYVTDIFSTLKKEKISSHIFVYIYYLGKHEISRLIIQWINLQICNTFFLKERVADYKYWIYIMMTFPILLNAYICVIDLKHL